MIKKLGFFFLFFAISWGIYSQDSLQVFPVNWRGDIPGEIAHHLQTYSSLAIDSGMIGSQLSKLSKEMGRKGYVSFQPGPWELVGDSLNILVFPGPNYRITSIQLDSLSPLVARRELDKWVDSSPPLDWESLESRLTNLLKEFPEKGYPFAQFHQEGIDYIPIDSGLMEVGLRYRFELGPKIHIHSLRFSGDIQDKESFLQSLSGIFPGDVFQQSRIQRLQSLLTNTRYFEEVSRPKVTFIQSGQADIEVEAQASRRGKFDAVLGILPPSESNQKLQFVGLVQLGLISPLGLGEYLSLDFRSLRASSQQLDLEVEFPYLFQLPFGIKGNLHMLKQSEDFLNVNGEAGLVYYIQPNFSVEALVSRQNSRLLELGESVQDSSLALLNADGNRQQVGLRIAYENLDYPFNSTKGLSLQVEATTGNRSIQQNSQIPEEKYLGLPESQKSTALQWELKSYLPLGRRQVIHLAYTGFHLDQGQFFQNDQLQVGGAKTLRGFNENEFFTDSYQQWTLELRLLLERASNLFIFGDYATLRNKVGTQQRRLNPLGLGIGMNYATKVGILSLSYGIGRAKGAEIPFEASRGKIHVGLVNRF